MSWSRTSSALTLLTSLTGRGVSAGHGCVDLQEYRKKKRARPKSCRTVLMASDPEGRLRRECSRHWCRGGEERGSQEQTVGGAAAGREEWCTSGTGAPNGRPAGAPPHSPPDSGCR